MSKICITGGAGFIGSHFCDRLIEDSHEVVALDNLVTGQTDNTENVFYHDRFHYYEHDATEFIHVSGDLDTVIHLASLASPVFYRKNPIETLKTGGSRHAQDPRASESQGREVPVSLNQRSL